MKRKLYKMISFFGVCFLLLFVVGCDSKKEEVSQTITFPTIIYKNQSYKSGYDDSNLLDKLPRGFKAIGKIKGVETSSVVYPTKEGYANDKAKQIRGVEKGTVIYGNKKVPNYIITEDHGKYVVYSSNSLDDIDYSEFLQGVTMKQEGAEESLSDQQEIQTTEMTRKELDVYEEAGRSILVHNDGKGLKNDFLEEGATGEDYLVGISFHKYDGINYETFYFSREEFQGKELTSFVEKAQDRLLELTGTSAKKGDLVKRYYWEFDEEEGEQGNIASQVILHKEESHANINDKDASVWLVHMDSSFERVEASHIYSQEILLNADYNEQKLVDFGRYEEDNAEKTTLSSYPEEQNGFSVEDESSMTGNYGRWVFSRTLREEDKINANPSILVSNTEGKLELSLQYFVELSTKSTSIFDKINEYHTGKVKILVPDR